MLRRLFLDHPESVDETYGEHALMALGFSLRLMGASLACLVHALVPGLCRTTGSRAIADLHARMVTNRRRHAAAPLGAAPTAGT